MKFGSEITLLKKFVAGGMVLSLLGIPRIAEAVFQITVQNNADSGAGSLRQAIIDANTDPQVNIIDFAGGFDIDLLSVLPTFTGQPAGIFGRAGLRIHRNNNPASPIFDAGGTGLYLFGYDDGLGGSNWQGSISSAAGSLVSLEQRSMSTYPGVISGPANVQYQGPFALTLTNQNTYLGTTTIQGGGIVNAGLNNALPVGNLIRLQNGTTLGINANITQTIARLEGAGGITIGNTGLQEIDSDTNSTFAGVMSGAGKFTKRGTGVFTLTNSSTHTGGTDILGGTLKVDALNALPPTDSVMIGLGATLDIATTRNQTLRSISGNGGITIGNASVLTIDTLANGSFAGNITAAGSGIFLKTGVNTLTLSGANSGDLQITGGGIKLAAGSSWNGPVTIGAATLEMNGGTVTQAITGNAAPTSILNVTGNFTPAAAITDVGTINVNAGGDFTVNPGFVPTGFSTFNVTGGTVNLNTNFTVPAAAVFTNTGSLTMNNNNFLMGTNAVFNSDSDLTTTGSIERAPAAAGYALNVRNGSTFAVDDPISGYTAFTVSNASTAQLNTGGSLSNGVVLNNGTFTINSGTLSGDITNTGGPSVLNVNTDFTPPGAVNVHTLNVNSGATFTPNTTVTTNTALNINSGGTLLFTNNIAGAGDVLNAGTITHTTNALRTIGGNFTLAQTGTINVAVMGTNPLEYSRFQVNGNTTLNGGVVNVEFLNSPTTINNGDTLDVLTSTGPLVANALPTTPTASPFVDFTPSIVNGNTLRLTADRLTYETFNEIAALEGVAEALDSLRVSNPFNPMVTFAEGRTSQSEFESFLDQLAPAGLNGLYTAPALTLGATDQILLRLDSIREQSLTELASVKGAKTGYAAGDMMEDRGSYGPIFFGNSSKQAARAGLPGYNAFTAGFGIVWDVPVLQYFRVGLGASYANSAVKESNNTGSNTTIGNTQGMLYGSATYGPLFLDAVLSAGANSYHGKRNIVSIGESVSSAYGGTQYSGKIKGGFSIPCYQIEISPTAAFQYLFLNVHKYTEKGSSSASLSVDAMRVTATRAYLGGRIADVSQEEDFFPELHAYYVMDLKNPNAVIASRFVAGGGSFISTGVQPPKNGINVGASISALILDNFMISGGYDLEAKKSFRSHSASLKFKYLF